MTENPVDRSSRSWMIALAVAAAAFVVWIAFSDRSAGPNDGAPPPSNPSNNAPKDASNRADEPLSEQPNQTLSGQTGDLEADPADSSAAARDAARRPGPGGRMPPQVLEDFRRGTVEVSPETLEALKRDPNDMPEDIRREFEGAGTREIPPEIRRDLENPYPKIPDDDYKILFGTDRPSDTQ